MTGSFFDLAVLIVGGIILANMLTNSTGTAAFFSGIGTLWSTSVNGLLGKSS